jgi:hypothetical protein
MLPGKDQVISCPKCQGLARYMTLKSGNTFGARVWTDGKQLAPMLPLPPTVVKCRHCAECYWLADAEEIGTIDRWQGEGQQVNPAWVDAQAVEEPAEEEYYQALEKGLATSTEQERELRVLAWWRRNDSFRDAPKEKAHRIAHPPGSWRKNLEGLARLLTQEDDNDRLMQAEVLRELGEFESAKQILNRVDSPDIAEIVRQIRSLCDTRDTCVRELQFST